MSYKNKITDLTNPLNFQDPIEISAIKNLNLIDLMKSMLVIRHVELKLALMKKNNQIKGPVHLGAGQEAIAVGVSCFLKPSDSVYGAHRSHAHLLALHGDPFRLFAEILGKAAGYSRGMGGSMHLCNPDQGFIGSVPIVAGTVPLAVGSALAAKLKGTNNIAVAYLGDGAIEEGVVHESLNLASSLELPVLFVVENNLFSSHMHISQRQPLPSTIRFALANNIESELIDGNDLGEVIACSNFLIDKIRISSRPAFIEAITYRHFGHVDWREDIDVGVNRSIEDLKNWKLRDPITRYKKAMIDNKIFSEAEFLSIENEIVSKIDADWDKALLEEFPHTDALHELVYE